ncbi:hypothetical protein LWI29_033291 [Acer saccharum]|uniref:Protein kinase domain-containing protein n=1 Tax=Acer saccharum TaxID=4024 RepID=A0AA39W190_ACESA|nr:hypothetical protein LWI29_033291 [Acer saccharum]
MKLTGGRETADGDGGGGKVVVVGVKFDAESRELLTWALVKVAESGDRVLALHVLDTVTESTGSLISLVNTFDSMLAVYEGFCNLKQVDLKLKVCRGTSVKKILVREAKSFGAAKVIVGASKTHHTIRSSVSVAKYCARKLSKCFGVFAVYNGKVVFEREATETCMDCSQDDNQHKNLVWLVRRLHGKDIKDESSVVIEEISNKECEHCFQESDTSLKRKTQKNNCTNCDSATQLLEEFPCDGNEDNSLALVPFQRSQLPRSRPGWAFLRWVFFKHQHSEKSHVKKTSLIQWVLGLPSQSTSAVVYPDHKQSHSDSMDESHCSDLDGESGAIVPVGHGAACASLSPCNVIPKELEGLHERFSSTCRLFNYQELLLVTSNFLPENIVGKGGHSHVYKGCLPDGKELAVKMLKPTEDVVKEFVLEIEIITALHHRNIISLFGFCYEDNKFLLVYDFQSRGSLEENLHGNKKDENAFGWRERYKVAVGVAEALDYLHNSCDQSVIHKDVKSSNILLSDDFEPQLSDFGLASRVSASSSNLTCTDVAGTFGYLAPEYFMHGKMSDKVDVYAFGVVLLELLTGKIPINSENPKGQESLVMWAKPILKDGKLSQLLDQSLGCDFDINQIERMVLAATLCIRRAPQFRPQMNLVLKVLEGDEEAINWARQEVSAPEECDIVDGEPTPTNFQSHLNLALLDLDDDSLSTSSTEQLVSVEDYLQGRWSRTSSFD